MFHEKIKWAYITINEKNKKKEKIIVYKIWLLSVPYSLNHPCCPGSSLCTHHLILSRFSTLLFLFIKENAFSFKSNLFSHSVWKAWVVCFGSQHLCGHISLSLYYRHAGEKGCLLNMLSENRSEWNHGCFQMFSQMPVCLGFENNDK